MSTEISQTNVRITLEQIHKLHTNSFRASDEFNLDKIVTRLINAEAKRLGIETNLEPVDAVEIRHRINNILPT